jgi:hypothetical protein
MQVAFIRNPLNKFKLVFFIVGSFPLINLAAEGVVKNSVLVTVAGKAVTERGLAIEAILANHKLFDPNKALKIIGEDKDRLLQKLIVRAMVIEENRVLSLYKVSKAEVDNAVLNFKKSITEDVYKKFLNNYELSESDLRERLSETIVLNQVLQQQDDLERWLKQLRSRHPISYFKDAKMVDQQNLQ